MPEKSSKWLVSFDTDRIKNFIFATNSLKEIRGASALLVNQDENRKKLPGVIFAAGGGGALVRESEEDATQAVQKIECEFRLATKTGSITVVDISPEKRPQSEWFGRHMEAAGKALQKKKSSKGELSLLPVEPYVRLCAACGYRPAEVRFQKDASGDLLCKSCEQKRQKGMEIRGEKSGEGFVSAFKDFIRKNGGDSRWLEALPPEDLNQLGELDGRGYIGFITADGNHIGKMLNLMETEENYQRFSKQLDNTMKDMVFDIMAKETKPVNKDGKLILPFEIVLVGGDDLTIFTPASLAPMLAVEIVQRFENESKKILDEAGLLAEDFCERLKKGWDSDEPPLTEKEPFRVHKKLTMAAGVVLCHANFPVPALVEIGETLQKKAKQKCAEKKGDSKSPNNNIPYKEGAIDFQVITGSASDIESARAAVPHHRPYTLTYMAKLIEFAEKFRNQNFPRSQLQMIYDACHYQTRARATLATLHTLGGLKKREHRKLLKEFLTTFAPAGYSYIQWPWTFIPEKTETLDLKDTSAEREGLKSAFVDLVDLYDFTKTKEDTHDKPNEN